MCPKNYLKWSLCGLFLLVAGLARGESNVVKVDWSTGAVGEVPEAGEQNLYAILNAEAPNQVALIDRSGVTVNPFPMVERALYIRNAASAPGQKVPSTRVIWDFSSGDPALKGVLTIEYFIHAEENKETLSGLTVVLAPQAADQPPNAMLADGAAAIVLTQAFPVQLALPASSMERIRCDRRSAINEVNVLRVEWDFTGSEPGITLTLNNEPVRTDREGENAEWAPEKFPLASPAAPGIGAIMIMPRSSGASTYSLGAITFESLP